MKTTIPVVKNTKLVKPGANNIRSGEKLTLKIKENKNSLIKAFVKGQMIEFRTSIPLKAGDQVEVLSEWKNNKLFFNIINGQKYLDIGNDFYFKLSDIIYQTAKRAGIPLKDYYLKELKKIGERKKDIKPEDLRMDIEKLKKGIIPESLSSVENISNNSNENKKEDIILFNNLKNGNELWFIIPINMKVEKENICGNIKIRKDLGLKKITTVVIETSYKENTIYFYIDNYHLERKNIKFFTEKELDRKIKKRINIKLNEILSNMNLIIDDNKINGEIIETCENTGFDGFSMDAKELDRIDTFI
ncbi:MAG: hypothetical protein PQJ46_14690 [Spirochaetales bacterium]|nr:hypothetical protein [Spirochaetales bacterium]